MPVKKNERVKKYEDFKVTFPEQMELFALLEPEEKDYSHTVELYDFLPKYLWGNSNRVEARFMTSLEREFECRNKLFKIIIKPARIIDIDKKEKDAFPGVVEELVEDALRKLAANGCGVYLDGGFAVCFTFYQLTQELKEHGHSYSNDQIKIAIQTLFGTSVELTCLTPGYEETHNFHLIENYGFKGSGEETQTYVKFSPLVTKSIQERTFRETNYRLLMSYSNVVARQLHKRLSHNYIYASFTKPYHILLSTFIRDTGMANYKLKIHQKRFLKALEELRDKRVILKWEEFVIQDARRKNKIADYKYVITPDPVFVSEMIHFNAHHKKHDSQAAKRLAG